MLSSVPSSSVVSQGKEEEAAVKGDLLIYIKRIYLPGFPMQSKLLWFCNFQVVASFNSIAEK